MNNNRPLASGRHLFGFFSDLGRHRNHELAPGAASVLTPLSNLPDSNRDGTAACLVRDRRCARTWQRSVGTIGLVAATARSLVFLLGSWSPDTAFMLPTTFAESTGWIVISITGGICEEVAYRGYLQRQLWAFTGSLPVAVCLQAVAFGAVHFYQGWKPVVVIVGIGFILGSVAAWVAALFLERLPIPLWISLAA